MHNFQVAAVCLIEKFLHFKATDIPANICACFVIMAVTGRYYWMLGDPPYPFSKELSGNGEWRLKLHRITAQTTVKKCHLVKRGDTFEREKVMNKI